MYVFQLFDAYCGAGTVLLLVVFGECLAIGWLYGEKSATFSFCNITLQMEYFTRVIAN